MSHSPRTNGVCPLGSFWATAGTIPERPGPKPSRPSRKRRSGRCCSHLTSQACRPCMFSHGPRTRLPGPLGAAEERTPIRQVYRAPVRRRSTMDCQSGERSDSLEGGESELPGRSRTTKMMGMDLSVARRRVQEAPVGRLGTVSPGGRPHLVPCCFALRADTVYTAVDANPKSSLALRRVANVAAQPAACLLVDHYEEDWSRLWWVRLDGMARVEAVGAEADEARRALVGKYPQYGRVAIPGPVIVLEIESWRAWP